MAAVPAYPVPSGVRMSRITRTTDSEKVDEYIARSEPFVRPILNHFRNLIHRTIPDVEERMRWNMPHFVVEGSAICYMAAFKRHVATGRYLKCPK